MHLQFEISKEDYTGFTTHYFKTKFLKYIVAFGIIGFLIVFFVGYKNGSPAFSAVPSAVFLLLYFGAVYGGYRKLKKGPAENSKLLGSKQMEIAEAYITCEGAHNSTSIAWPQVKKLESTPSAFYLYVKPNLLFIIPKRAFASESQSMQFESMVLAKIK